MTAARDATDERSKGGRRTKLQMFSSQRLQLLSRTRQLEQSIKRATSLTCDSRCQHIQAWDDGRANPGYGPLLPPHHVVDE